MQQQAMNQNGSSGPLQAFTATGTSGVGHITRGAQSLPLVLHAQLPLLHKP